MLVLAMALLALALSGDVSVASSEADMITRIPPT